MTPAIDALKAGPIDMKLEVVVIPVADVDRAKRFYEELGWRLDADFVRADGSRAVQFTPPGSPCSIQLGTAPVLPLYLVVNDIEAARAELFNRGVSVSEVFHRVAPSRTAASADRIRSGAVTRHSPRSAIRTATPGWSRR